MRRICCCTSLTYSWRCLWVCSDSLLGVGITCLGETTLWDPKATAAVRGLSCFWLKTVLVLLFSCDMQFWPALVMLVTLWAVKVLSDNEVICDLQIANQIQLVWMNSQNNSLEVHGCRWLDVEQESYSCLFSYSSYEDLFSEGTWITF